LYLKVALYARVSTTDQGQNPETQLYRLRAIAEARGYEVHKEYVDFASGKNPNRPAFQNMMNDARTGCFNLILVTRLDRMMRSTKNLFNVLEQLEEWKIGFQCTEQDISTTGAMGRLMLTFLSGLAEFERELTLERSREGTARALAEGKVCHRPKGSKDKKKRKKKGSAKVPPSLFSEPARKSEVSN
jgi:site-specific DNA recombinase